MRTLTLLVIGSGGREHALAWSLARSPHVKRLFVAPGNAGTALADSAWVEDPPAANAAIDATDVAGLLVFAREQAVDLTVVGPEVALAAGIVDVFQAAGLPIFGPSQAAAQLESSKAFAKSFMEACSIPTAAAATFSDYETARRYLASIAGPVVVKASGLAAGKGVTVCDNAAQAETAVRQMMVEKVFGEAGATILIEERLTGPELSLMAFCDGRTVLPLLPARDHKRVWDGDQGPNTGGMGAFAPAATAGLVDEIVRAVLQPAVDGLAAAGTPYTGVLYAGVMLTAAGIKVLEFNCRFGDPETQAVLPLLESDLVEVMQACIAGRLDQIALRWRSGACATVIMAALGYPGPYTRGSPITGLAAATAMENVAVFHAGTARRQGQLVTGGGRVLAVSGLGDDVAAALDHAYTAVGHIHFDGAHYRRDIGRYRPATVT
jgi:phosphoribosylamine---glycine ligase